MNYRCIILCILIAVFFFQCVNQDIGEEPLPSVCKEDISWHEEIQPLMITYCAKSGCHNGISRSNNWENYNEVRSNVTQILQQINSGNMPFDQPLPADKLKLIECWISQGANDN